MTYLIHNARILTETGIIEAGWLRTGNGVITAFDSGPPPTPSATNTIDAQGNILAPGFIDLHTHGGLGYEAMDASAESLVALAQFYAQHGVTSFLPTTWTARHERIMEALRAIGDIAGQHTGGAQIIGAHVEGPYLNLAKSGAQDPAVIRRATPDEIREILDTGVVKLIALAPEYPENLQVIAQCCAKGAVVSAAHTDATYADMLAAVEQGLTQTTHTYNAMRGLHHREPGTVGAALTIDTLFCEVIPDVNHLHPAVINLLYRVKGVDRTIIITDAVRGAGLPDGSTYTQDGRPVSISDGAARLEDSTLAGSILTMDEAVRNFIQATDARMEDAFQCASLTPARAINIAEQKGSITIGKDADLILTDDELTIHMTMVQGRIVHQLQAQEG